MSVPILACEGVSKRFGEVTALENLDLEIPAGEFAVIVGASGCGKTTLARMLVGLDRQTSGEILLDGQPVLGGRSREGARLARRVQYVFQDPLSSLNPRKTIRQILEAPLRHLLAMPQADRAARLQDLMDAVRLRPEFLERYIRVGVETGIPLMIPGSHLTLLKRQYRDEAIERLKRRGEWRGQHVELPASVERAPEVGRRVWDAGLPVLDDLHNTSYGWRLEKGVEPSDENLRELKVTRYSQALRELRPGITMMIMHCADPGPAFDRISSSGPTRKGDMLAMLDPRLQKVLDEEGIVLATWRELGERRRWVGR